MELIEKVAIVTGAGAGVGKAIANRFLQEGANVIIADINLEAANSTVEEMKSLGKHVVAKKVDVSKLSEIEEMVNQVITEFGQIDILVNNAGIIRRALLLDMLEDDWDKVIDIDLKGYFLCSQAVAKRMVERKKGNIINIASVNGMRALKRSGAYCIAKAGVLMLTRVLALELGRDNIRVNAIVPILVRTTDMAQAWVEDPEALRRFESSVPLGRMAEPSDIAATALFLASDASSLITGHPIIVDGGSQV